MANFNKPFNFRGGFQVGEDVLIVRGGTVGINTATPREVLDVDGNIIATGSIDIDGDLNALNGEITARTFTGDGSGLTDVPASIGATGATGLIGDDGPRGLRGPRGPKGDPSGATGIQGDVGERGATGFGATGPRGPDGATGATGKGWTGASYSPGTGKVTFQSNDGLGFVTGDLRGATGSGATGASGLQGSPGNPGTNADISPLKSGTYINGVDYTGAEEITWSVDATSANTASKVVARNSSGNFSAGTINATLNGSAGSLTNSRTLWGQSFNGTANVSGSLTGVSAITASGNIIAGEGSGSIAMTVNDGAGNANLTFNHASKKPDLSGNAGRISVNVDETTNATMSFGLKSSVAVNTSADLKNILTLSETAITPASGIVFSGSLSGNSSTATKLATSRTLWGQSFDGTANVSGSLTNVNEITGNSTGNMTIQPGDGTSTRTLILRGNNDTNNTGGGGVLIGDSGRGDISFQTRGLYKFARATSTTIEGILNFNELSGDRTFTFPNTTGTIALTSSTVDKATVATKITVTLSDDVNNNNARLLFVDSNSPDSSRDDDAMINSNLSFQRQTGTLSSTNFSGSGSSLTNLNASNISSGTISDARLPSSISSNISGTATNATNINVLGDNTATATHYIIFTGGTTGNQRPNSDSSLKYVPSTNILTAGTFDGNFTGNGAGITNITTDNIIEGTQIFFTNERAQDAVATSIANGTQVGMDVSYNDTNNAIDFKNWILIQGNTNRNLSKNALCYVNTSGRTIKLPGGSVAPNPGDKVLISIDGPWKDTKINRNGSNIMGIAQDMFIDIGYVGLTFIYVDANFGWRVF